MTPFAALQSACGLSNREAAEFLGTEERYIERLRRGSRGNRAGPDYLRRLAELAEIILAASERAADAILDAEADTIEIGYPADDHEARDLGFPCVGAWRAMVGRALSAAICDGLDPARIRLVPRGSTPATAAAIDAHEETPPAG